jgi:hypothetical protein
MPFMATLPLASVHLLPCASTICATLPGTVVPLADAAACASTPFESAKSPNKAAVKMDLCRALAIKSTHRWNFSQ